MSARNEHREHIKSIIKFGLKQSELETICCHDEYPVDLLLAHVAHLESKNEKLVDGLERIASGMLTKGESEDQAQFSLENVTLRDWRNTNNDKQS